MDFYGRFTPGLRGKMLYLSVYFSKDLRFLLLFLDGGTEKEVGVIKNADWWTLVPRPEKNANSPPDSDIEEEKTLLDGQYVLVEV